jgi:PhnB protein
MHTSFKAPGVAFMASDAMRGELAPPGTATPRVRLSIASADAAEGERVFAALAEGGTVTLPYQKQFWGAHFGMVTDRFGIDWMVNAG